MSVKKSNKKGTKPWVVLCLKMSLTESVWIVLTGQQTMEKADECPEVTGIVLHAFGHLDAQQAHAETDDFGHGLGEGETEIL